MMVLKKNVSGYFPRKSGRKVHVAAQKSEDVKGVHTWLSHKRTCAVIKGDHKTTIRIKRWKRGSAVKMMAVDKKKKETGMRNDIYESQKEEHGLPYPEDECVHMTA